MILHRDHGRVRSMRCRRGHLLHAEASFRISFDWPDGCKFTADSISAFQRTPPAIPSPCKSPPRCPTTVGVNRKDSTFQVGGNIVIPRKICIVASLLVCVTRQQLSKLGSSVARRTTVANVLQLVFWQLTFERKPIKCGFTWCGWHTLQFR